RGSRQKLRGQGAGEVLRGLLEKRGQLGVTAEERHRPLQEPQRSFSRRPARRQGERVARHPRRVLALGAQLQPRAGLEVVPGSLRGGVLGEGLGERSEEVRGGYGIALRKKARVQGGGGLDAGVVDEVSGG